MYSRKWGKFRGRISSRPLAAIQVPYGRSPLLGSSLRHSSVEYSSRNNKPCDGSPGPVTDSHRRRGGSAVESRRVATGLTGDRVESKGASSGRRDLLVSVSPAACRARPGAIATKNAHFAFLTILWEVRKAAGLAGDRAESKRASSGRPDLPVTVLLLLAARDQVP